MESDDANAADSNYHKSDTVTDVMPEEGKSTENIDNLISNDTPNEPPCTEAENGVSEQPEQPPLDEQTTEQAQDGPPQLSDAQGTGCQEDGQRNGDEVVAACNGVSQELELEGIDDDSEDEVNVVIGDLSTSTSGYSGGGALRLNKQPAQFAAVSAADKSKTSGGLTLDDFDSFGSINGVPVHEFSIDALDEKPWRKPGADITDFFNYGFTEETWRAYCERQQIMRVKGSGAGISNLPLRPFHSSSTLGGRMGGSKLSAHGTNAGIDVLGSSAPSRRVDNMEDVLLSGATDYSVPPPVLASQALVGHSATSLLFNQPPPSATFVDQPPPNALPAMVPTGMTGSMFDASGFAAPGVLVPGQTVNQTHSSTWNNIWQQPPVTLGSDGQLTQPLSTEDPLSYPSMLHEQQPSLTSNLGGVGGRMSPYTERSGGHHHTSHHYHAQSSSSYGRHSRSPGDRRGGSPPSHRDRMRDRERDRDTRHHRRRSRSRSRGERGERGSDRVSRRGHRSRSRSPAHGPPSSSSSFGSRYGHQSGSSGTQRRGPKSKSKRERDRDRDTRDESD